MSDEVIPEGKWEFDGDVTEAFDDMLARSIPQYDVMREATFNLACEFIQPHTAVIDLGASRGGAVAPLIDKYALKNRFYLVEISDPMIDVLRSRFEHYININSVKVDKLDLRNDFPQADASIIMSILTLQFTPIEYRQRIIRQVYEQLLPGGAFIFVEKVIGQTSEIDDVMVKHYLAKKSESGYTAEQIYRKRLSLEGVLVPITAEWNMDMLRNAGFRHVDCFWRWMNFAGWVAIKDK